MKEDEVSYLPPWPEWSDQELNIEAWDVQEGKQRPRTSLSSVREHATTPTQYHDPLGKCPLPPSISSMVSHWRRLHSSTVFTEDDAPPDIKLINIKILHSPLMVSILSAIFNLQQFTRVHQIQIDGCENFVPTKEDSWKPWHHVYSRCKAGKGVIHKPIPNLTGKYIVRLWFLGKWRRIEVDNCIPISDKNLILLPMTENNDMWLPILCKAILRVASLTWEYNDEFSSATNLNVISLLTGWHEQLLYIKNSDIRYVWWLLVKLLKSRLKTHGVSYHRDKTQPNIWVPDRCISIFTDIHDIHQYKENTDVAMEELGTLMITAGLSEPIVADKHILSPCIIHEILLSRAQKFSYSNNSLTTPIARWKYLRYLQWAVDRGLIEDPRIVHKEKLRIYSYFKNFDPQVEVNNLVNPLMIDLIDAAAGGDAKYLSLTKVSEVGSKSKNKKDKSKSLSKKGKNRSTSKEKEKRESSKERDKKRSSKSKSKSESSKRTKTPPAVNMEYITEIEIWLEFNDLVSHFSYLRVIYQPKSFNFIKNIQDFGNLNDTSSVNVPKETTKKKSKEKKNKKGKDKKNSLLMTEGKSSGTLILEDSSRCVYMLIDSLNCKKVLFSLNTLSLQSIEFCRQLALFNKCDDPENIEEPKVDQHTTYEEIIDDLNLSLLAAKASFIIGELYNWQNNSLGDIVFKLTCYNNIMKVIKLNEGLIVLRIWPQVPRNFSLTIASQTSFIIGSKGHIQRYLSQYSVSLLYYSMKIKNQFEDILQRQSDSLPAAELIKSSIMPSSEVLSANEELKDDLFKRFEEGLMDIIRQNFNDKSMIVKYLFHIQQLFSNKNFGMGKLNQEEYEEMIYMQEENEKKEDAQHHSIEDNSNNKRNKKSRSIESKQRSRSSSKSSKAKDSKESKTSKDGKRSKDKMKRSKSQDKSKKEDSELGRKVFYNQEQIIILLKMMFRNNFYLLKFFPFRNDFTQLLTYDEYHGSVTNSSHNKWLPLMIYKIDHHRAENDEVLNDISFISTLDYTVLRIINNKTLQEVSRFATGVEAMAFSRGNDGYTLFGYGFQIGQVTNTGADVNWQLRIAAENSDSIMHGCQSLQEGICRPMQPVALEYSKETGYYFPNKRNFICKYLLTTELDVTVSIRFWLSNKDVQFLLRVLHNEEPVQEYESVGEIIIPVIEFLSNISYVGDEDEDFYVIETYVVNGSWELTPEEEHIVEILEERAKQKARIFPVPSLENLKRTHSKIEEVVNEAPRWELLIITDAATRYHITLQPDQRRQIKIQEIKREWERAEMGRHRKAYGLRQKFLESYDKNVPLDKIMEQFYEEYENVEKGEVEVIDSNVAKISFLTSKCWQDFYGALQDSEAEKHVKLITDQHHRNNVFEKHLTKIFQNLKDILNNTYFDYHEVLHKIKQEEGKDAKKKKKRKESGSTSSKSKVNKNKNKSK